MINRNVDKQILALKNLIKYTDTATDESIELMSHWAKYICILAAGLLENAIKEIYSDFIISASSKPVANYATSVLTKIQNPKSSKYIEIAGKFNIIWAKELTEYLEKDGRGDAIDSIMANRHLIAHGKYSGITMTRIKEYIEKSLEVIDFIESQCNS
jgi:hypothetical protein